MSESLAALMDGFAPHPNSNMARLSRASGVVRGAEFVRILNLPRRQTPRDLSQEITDAYKTPNGTMALRSLQAYSLTEVYDYGGLFCLMPVGSGKTLVSLLAPRILEAQRPLLIVPANLKTKTTEHDIPFYRQHWRLHPNLRVISYSKLSRAPSATAHLDRSGDEEDLPSGVLWDLQPDVVIADEIHHLKNPKSARTRRFLRYFREKPETVLIALSGTMTRKSLRDYWHIIQLCLRLGCPLPRNWNAAQQWADALDANVPDDKRVSPGALMEFCEPGETVRQGFRRRLLETPGVIGAMGASAFGDEEEPGIEIHEVEPPEVPDAVEGAFAQLRQTWCTPGGEEISDGMSLWRHASSLAYGYYLRWIWPNGEPDKEWLDKRKAWKKFVRETLKHNRRGLDSELQVARACELGASSGGYDSGEWGEWVQVRDRHGPNGPPTEAVWISDWIIEHAAAFRDVEIIWTRSPALGTRIAERAGVPYFGAGADEINDFTGRKLVASIQSHGTGKNLQRYSKSLFVGTPYGGDKWQQVLGRTHRPGQAEDVVSYYVYLHCKELWTSFQRACEEARYVQETTDDRQKLLQATINFHHTEDMVASLETMGHPRWV